MAMYARESDRTIDIPYETATFLKSAACKPSNTYSTTRPSPQPHARVYNTRQNG